MENNLKNTVEIDIRSLVNCRKRFCQVRQAKNTNIILTCLAPFCSHANPVTASLCPDDLWCEGFLRVKS